MNPNKYNIYRIPNTTPLLITLLDGSGSMREYSRIVEVYQSVFGEFNDYYRLEYQLTQDLHPLIPYLQSGTANLTKTFTKLFSQMLAQNFPKNITIIFISDGREVFQIKEIEELIERVKKTYCLQFMCIAIGDQFPNSINEIFQKHNNLNQPYFHTIQRSSRKTHNMIHQDFFEAFNSIKNLLPETTNKIHLNEKVRLTLTSSHQIDIVQPGSAFLAEKAKIININDQELFPSKDYADLLEIITTSMQEALLQQAQEHFQFAKTEFNKIHSISYELLQQMGETKDDENYEQIQNLLNIATLIAEGTLDLQSLNEFQFENLQVALATNNLDKTNKIVSLLTNKGQDEQNLTPQIINLICSLEFKQLRTKSLKKSSEDLEGPVIQSCFNIVKDSLKKYHTLFTETPYSNFIEILKEFKDLIFKALAGVFDSEAFKIKDSSHLDILESLNKIIGTITKLSGKTTLEEATNILRCFLVKEDVLPNVQDEHEAIQGEISQALFDSSDEFKFLPKSVQLSLRDDSDNFEPMLIFIFDKSDSMLFENTLAQRTLKSILGDTNRIELEWGNKKLQILHHPNYNNKTYYSLSEVFDELEIEYKLSQKRILLCLISDGQNEYRTLHQQIKIAKLQKYYLKMIYLAVGGQFHIRIENDIVKKFQNQQVKGKPWLFKIPKKLKIDIYKSEVIQQSHELINPFQKAFQDLYTKYTQGKL